MTRPGGSVRRRNARSGHTTNRKSRVGKSVAKNEQRAPSTRYTISVRNEQTHLSVPASRIRQIARKTLAAEAVAAAAISVALIDNQAIHRLNRQHLNHDYETDVLSFLFDSEPGNSTAKKDGPRGQGCRIDGEIIISAEMALQSASKFGWSGIDELTLYLVHGLLHLCGYDDVAASERRLMRKREQEILQLLGD
jgi:probable rRNA maturation factor